MERDQFVDRLADALGEALVHRLLNAVEFLVAFGLGNELANLVGESVLGQWLGIGQGERGELGHFSDRLVERLHASLDPGRGQFLRRLSFLAFEHFRGHLEDVMFLGPAAGEGVERRDILHDWLSGQVLPPFVLGGLVPFAVRPPGLIEKHDHRFADPLDHFDLEIDIPDGAG